MKKFAIVLLGFISATLIAGSVQFVAADHLEPGIGIYKNDEHEVNLISTKGSKYQVYVQIEVRNEHGQLISISENSIARHVPHKITDMAFNEKLGKKEIVTIDNIKYEKAGYSGTLDTKQMLGDIDKTPHFMGLWKFEICGEIHGHGYRCIPIFQANTPHVSITEEDVVTAQWTVLRVMD